MNLKPNHIEFQNEIERREIKYLIHFTPTLNLYSILEQEKLMSRATLENLDIEQFDILDYVQFTDNVRYDDKNYLNLSLSGPNTFLFSKFRQKTANDITINWCVLTIDPNHIYDSETLFSVANAASNAAKRQFGISGDIQKFKQLFSQELNINTFTGTRNIKRGNIANKFPTDVQAEILIKNSLPSSSIISVCFQTEEKLAEAKAAMYEFDTKKFIVNSEIFNPNRNK